MILDPSENSHSQIGADKSVDIDDGENSDDTIEVQPNRPGRKPQRQDPRKPNQDKRKIEEMKPNQKHPMQKYQTMDEQHDPSYEAKPKQREFIQCHNMTMITKVTQMLDLINRSGIDITSG